MLSRETVSLKLRKKSLSGSVCCGDTRDAYYSGNRQYTAELKKKRKFIIDKEI